MGEAIVIIMAIVGSLAQNPGGMTKMDGLDCRHPRSVRTGSLNKICGTPTADTDDQTEDALVLTYTTKHTVKAYRCTRIESTFREVCGMWSHSKLYEPPTIMQEALVTQEQCLQMALHSTYMKVDRNVMPITVNHKAQYQFCLLYTSPSPRD